MKKSLVGLITILTALVFALFITMPAFAETIEYTADHPAVTFHGEWEEAGAGAVAVSRHGKLLQTGVPGDYFEVTFVGTEVQFISRSAPGVPILEIFLDGVSQGKVDGYSEEAIPERVYFEKKDLEPGEHVLKVVNTGEKPVGSQNTRLFFDTVVVKGTTAVASPGTEVTNPETGVVNPSTGDAGIGVFVAMLALSTAMIALYVRKRVVKNKIQSLFN